MRAVNPFCFVLLGLLLAGCAKYEYNIVHPPDLSAHIGRNTTTS
jgi:hypothetical protein